MLNLPATTIKKFVALSGVMSDHDKADVLLVWSGFKQVALVDISCQKNTKGKVFTNRIESLEKILRELSLKFKLHVNYPKNTREVTRYSYIAKTDRDLKSIMSADAEKNQKIRRMKTGLLLGYPKSAVVAFANNKSVDAGKLPKRIFEGPIGAFLTFRLSKKWRDELDYVKKYSQEIKKISPEIYKKIGQKKRTV